MRGLEETMLTIGRQNTLRISCKQHTTRNISSYNIVTTSYKLSSVNVRAMLMRKGLLQAYCTRQGQSRPSHCLQKMRQNATELHNCTPHLRQIMYTYDCGMYEKTPSLILAKRCATTEINLSNYYKSTSLNLRT